MFRKKSTDEGIALLPAHILVWTYAALLGIPVYFVIVSAFKDNISIFDTPLAIPKSLTFHNFVEAWNTVKLGHGLINSVIVTTLSEIVALSLGLPAAYGIARSRGKVGAVVERIFALGFLIPAFAAMVPTLLLSIKVHMYHTIPFSRYF